MRTHTNNELTAKDVGKKVALVGWVHTRRDHGGIIFIDLRDKFGLTQAVFDPDFDNKHMQEADKLRREDCILIKGEVKARKQGMKNSKLPTGEVEVFVNHLQVFNKAQTPPLEVDDRIEANEDTRLKYRYLDLRRPIMQKRLLVRHQLLQEARKYFTKEGFTEIETPLLVKSTPEGARDYVVPSRVHPGKVYALPQSPQLYKQLLMLSGCDRYFQVAKCLRDEDLRADRQPEHTQLDFEMSFVTSKDIRTFVEGLYKALFKVIDVEVKTPFPKLTHKECMDRFGSDKPDLRYGLELTDTTTIVKNSDFSVFKDVAAKEGVIKCINPEKDLGRKEIDAYIEYCQQHGAKGMAWMRVTKEGLESNIAKFFGEEVKKKLLEATKAKEGSILMFIADTPKRCNEILDKLRRKLAEDLKLVGVKKFAPVWIDDFPLFAYNEEEKRWGPEHHMFSMPKEEYVKDFEKRPEEVKGDLWDLVINGLEMGSGSIRVSDPALQERIMKFIGMSKQEAQKKFGFLLEAYQYGAPVHGGMGMGFDRLVAVMCGLNDIREVIAFPRNKAAENPLDDSPSAFEQEQLKELHLDLDATAKKNIL